MVEDNDDMRHTPSNPTNSEWYSTPPAKRKRRGIEVTLSAKERGALDYYIKVLKQPRARVVAAMIAYFANASLTEAKALIQASYDADEKE